MKKIFFGLCVLLFVGATVVSAQQLTVTWPYDPAWEAGIQGFNVYYGQASHVGVTDPTNANPASGDPAPYQFVQQVANPSARQVTVSVTAGQWYARVTAYGMVDGALTDSAFSASESNCFIGLFAPSGAVSCTITP